MTIAASTLYQARRPVELAKVPAVFYYTTLATLRKCPRRWQLTNSDWPWGKRYPDRPSESQLLGVVVHAALEELAHRLASAGSPPFGTPDFDQIGRAFLAEGRLAQILADELKRFEENPRARALGKQRLRLDDCRNALVRLLKLAWGTGRPRAVATPRAALPPPPPARQGSAVPRAGEPPRYLHPSDGERFPEIELRHPRLPLAGILDLVCAEADGDIIIDYKTGSARPEHLEQLRLYGLLWWRETGRLPRVLRVVPGEGQSTLDEIVRAEDLEEVERRLAVEALEYSSGGRAALLHARPSNEACEFCPVRQVCDPYWTSPKTGRLRWRRLDVISEGLRDAELEVSTPMSSASVRARLHAGQEVTLQTDPAVWNVAGLPPGRKVRALVVAAARDGSAELRTVRGSELYEFEGDEASGPPGGA